MPRNKPAVPPMATETINNFKNHYCHINKKTSVLYLSKNFKNQQLDEQVKQAIFFYLINYKEKKCCL